MSVQPKSSRDLTTSVCPLIHAKCNGAFSFCNHKAKNDQHESEDLSSSVLSLEYIKERTKIQNFCRDYEKSEFHATSLPCCESAERTADKWQKTQLVTGNPISRNQNFSFACSICLCGPTYGVFSVGVSVADQQYFHGLQVALLCGHVQRSLPFLQRKPRVWRWKHVEASRFRFTGKFAQNLIFQVGHGAKGKMASATHFG